LDNTEKSFYSSLNAIFVKIVRLASEEVNVDLLCVKCLPILIYGLYACALCLSYKCSLDFIITRTFMKIFQTSSFNVVQERQTTFHFRRVSDLILERKKFFAKILIV